ncbi:MAG: tetratricopeptide repeat protein [Gemmatimonadetes bacterium]|nr:tetratricopeptide repeat protein [Gemmatimonadota bacterium]
MSAILVILLFLGWQPAVKNARGNELYQQEKYDEALAAYEEALAEDGENPALHYNRGNALYRSDQYPTAVQAYTNALDGEAPVSGRARYNMGNSLYRMGLLKDSIEAYKAGLRIEPDDIDMKYNLEYVMRQLQQQEEQERRNAQDRQEDPANQDGQADQEDPDEREDPDDRNDGGPEPEEEESPEAPPPPREGELSRAEAERLLNALNRDEQDIQRRLRRQQATQVNPEKDW